MVALRLLLSEMLLSRLPLGKEGRRRTVWGFFIFLSKVIDGLFVDYTLVYGSLLPAFPATRAVLAMPKRTFVLS
jgi:hypothetical protein